MFARQVNDALERFAVAVGLDETDLERISPLPEVAEYLAALYRLFIEADYLAALGAELAVEVTAAAEFRYFYPGLLPLTVCPLMVLPRVHLRHIR